MPTITSFTAYPTGVTSSNNLVFLSFTISGAASWSISPSGGSGTTGTSGSYSSGTTVAPSATTVYTLTATATGGGTATATVTVTVSDTTAPTLSISASATTITAGQSVTITLDWTYANTITMDHGVGSSFFSYFRDTVTVTPSATMTYNATVTNAVGTVSQSVTITVTGSAPSAFESDHPYLSKIYSYQVPSWPGGTNTIYVTLSQDTFVDPWGGTFVVSTNLASQSYTDIQLAGFTLAIQSSDGIIDVNTSNGGGQQEMYGFRALSVSLSAPTSYLLGNPNSLDYVNNQYSGALYDPSNNAEGPNYVYADLTATTLRLTPSQLNMAQMGTTYQYGMRFPNASGTVTWSVSSGALPPGLTLNTSTGVISGTPTTGGPATFTISATDGTHTASGSFFIGVYNIPSEVGLGSVGSPYPQAAYTADDWPFVAGMMPYGFHRNGARWCTLARRYQDSSNLVRWPTMFKSLDDGITWTEVGTASRPTPPMLFAAWSVTVGQGQGNGSVATYNYTSGSAPNPVVAGMWTQISGFNQVTGLNLEAANILSVGSSGDPSFPYFFTVNCTAVGTENAGTNADPLWLAGATSLAICNFVTKSLPTGYTPNFITRSGHLANPGSQASLFYNDGSSNTIYYVTWFGGDTGNGVPQFCYQLWTFDLATETWTDLTPNPNFFAGYGGPSGFGNGTGQGLVVLSTGVWRLFFYGDNTNEGTSATTTQSPTFGQYMVEYTPGTGWGTPVLLWSGAALSITSGGTTIYPSFYITSYFHQTHSFVGGGAVDITHVLVLLDYGRNDLSGTCYYAQINSGGIAYQTQIATSEVNSPYYTGLPIMQDFGSAGSHRLFIAPGGWAALPGANQLAVSFLCRNNDSRNNHTASDFGPGIMRVTLTSTPTLSFEYVAPWNVNTGAQDFTVWSQNIEYPAIGVTSTGQLACLWSAMGYLVGSSSYSGDGVYYCVNSGTDETGWSPVVELWSENWDPFDGTDAVFRFTTSAPISVEARSAGGFYVHLDGFPSTSLDPTGQGNYALPPLQFPSVLLQTVLRIIFQELGPLTLVAGALPVALMG